MRRVDAILKRNVQWNRVQQSNWRRNNFGYIGIFTFRSCNILVLKNSSSYNVVINLVAYAMKILCKTRPTFMSKYLSNDFNATIAYNM